MSLILAALVLPSGTHAAAGSAEPPFRFYTVLDGLTQSEVYDIEHGVEPERRFCRACIRMRPARQHECGQKEGHRAMWKP